MKTLFTTTLATFVFFLFSCGNSTGNSDEMDSLRIKVAEQESQLVNDEEFIQLMNVSMDSVIMADGSTILNVREGVIPTKNKMRQNLEAYKLILQSQREKILELQNKLENQKTNHSKQLKELLAKLTLQLDEKDAEIARLQELVENDKVTIAELNKTVGVLKKDISDLKIQNKEQENALITQSNMMNEAYYIVGSKKELKQLGLVSGGNIFKKSKLDLSQIDASKFRKIDIRETTSISIPGKSPKILTQAPKGSYTISSNGSGSVLVINDATSFWSVNNYLVIQY